jgi:hypothetical protein
MYSPSSDTIAPNSKGLYYDFERRRVFANKPETLDGNLLTYGNSALDVSVTPRDGHWSLYKGENYLCKFYEFFKDDSGDGTDKKISLTSAILAINNHNIDSSYVLDGESVYNRSIGVLDQHTYMSNLPETVDPYSYKYINPRWLFSNGVEDTTSTADYISTDTAVKSHNYDLGSSLCIQKNVVTALAGVGALLTLGIGGTKILAKLAKANPVYANPKGKSTDKCWLVNYKRDIFDTQYGGPTDYSRSQSKYIPATKYIPTYGFSSSNCIAYGDTYIAIFDNLRSEKDVELDGKCTIRTNLDSDSVYAARSWYARRGAYGAANCYRTCFVSVHFPVETTINLSYTLGRPIHRNLKEGFKLLYSRENAGTYYVYKAGDINYDPTNNSNYLVETIGVYQYNSVYSRLNNTKEYSSKPYIWEDNKNLDCTITVSGMKVSGELTDSWLKFGDADKLEVESKHGSLNALLQFNNRLFFWQNKAFGILSVNDRSLISDSSGAQLVLGTGGILDRYDYISTENGSRSKWHTTAALSGLYWYDNFNNRIVGFSNNIDILSKTKLVQSYINNLSITDALIYFDKLNNEVLFNLKESSIYHTLSYSEYNNSFSSFYTYNPTIYHYFNNVLLTSTTNSNVYGHCITGSLKCNFYGVQYNSTLSLLVNPDYDLVKVFDKIEYESNSYSLTDNIELFSESFNSLRCYNDYQNTDYITLMVGDNLLRPERLWKAQVPRNAVNQLLPTDPDITDPSNLTTDRLFRERMRDKYMIIDLIYNNLHTGIVEPDRLNISSIYTYYRVSRR